MLSVSWGVKLRLRATSHTLGWTITFFLFGTVQLGKSWLIIMHYALHDIYMSSYRHRPEIEYILDMA